MSIIKVKDDELEIACVCPNCNFKIIHKIFEAEGKNVCEDYYEPIKEKINDKNTEESSINDKTESDQRANGEGNPFGNGIRNITENGEPKRRKICGIF